MPIPPDAMNVPGALVKKRGPLAIDSPSCTAPPCSKAFRTWEFIFEEYFREVAAAWGDLAKFAEINRKYSLEMDFDSVPRLCERFGVTFPPL
jgi:hypothetical protein